MFYKYFLSLSIIHEIGQTMRPQSEKLHISVAEIMRGYNIGFDTVIETLKKNGYDIPKAQANVKVPFSCIALFDAEYNESAQQQLTGRTIIANHKSSIRKQKKQKRDILLTSNSTNENTTSPNFIGGTQTLGSIKDYLKEKEIREKERKRVDERMQLIKQYLRKNKPIQTRNTKTQNTDRFTYQNITTIIVEWSKIIFSNGSIRFSYNEKLYFVTVKEAKVEYNHIIKTFARRLQPIKISISNSTAAIIDSIEFERVISILDIHNHIFNIEDNGYNGIDIKTLKSIPNDMINTIYPIDKTEYLEYLQCMQDENINILPVFETRQNYPDGFLFTIKRDDACYIVWESSKQFASKATYIFIVNTLEIESIQQLLFDFIISGIDKKRHFLRNNKITNLLGVDYYHIDHDGFYAWKTILEQLINKDKSSIGNAKNEKTITYDVQSKTRSYIPTHNIIQNGLKAALESSGKYRYVLLEDDNVDVKALTNDNEWHYYEVKTSVPRLCIREALGQILEYTHYNCKENVTELFIVGQYEPSEQELNYISLLKEMYNLPISYQWYDLATQTLHSNV